MGSIPTRASIITPRIRDLSFSSLELSESNLIKNFQDSETKLGPRPKPTTFLVRVQARGINPLSTKIRASRTAPAKHPLSAVLGLDAARTVEEVGSAVTTCKPGGEVYGMVGSVGGLQGTLADFVLADGDGS